MITAATYRGNQQIGDASYRVLIRLVTDDARGTFDQWFTVQGTTLGELRDSISKQIASLNTVQPAKGILDGISVGTTIPVTYSPPAASAAQVWATKVRRLHTLRSYPAAVLAIAGIASVVTALEADVVATYQAGHEASL